MSIHIDYDSQAQFTHHRSQSLSSHCCVRLLLSTSLLPLAEEPHQQYLEMGHEGEVVLIQNSEDLKSRLEKAGTNLVVIDFFAVWCGPCKIIGPKIEELSKELQDVVFLKIDVDECEDLAAEYDIASMPTFVFIKEGKVLETFAGANYDKLKSTIQKHK
ncbi:hypothetical protein DMN91_000147 [Ooceraea biroi]|uniref:Thioredoxin domain-containing protein n=1 Tax=Ooceraea biroi TaxID=2015173 RepID=A0A3L8E1L9_OOCBI|nr:thioredoxin-2 [Ooceraea biroi]RLU26353.1 hypothetical protein DMN91_000147 [Ooceraea biroi]